MSLVGGSGLGAFLGGVFSFGRFGFGLGKQTKGERGEKIDLVWVGDAEFEYVCVCSV